jgi:beta-glucosidase-like glycosyl hydrolase
MAVVLLTAVFAGFRVTSDNEQAIRLALGQSNYVTAGEEGPQYFETEYEEAAELRTDSAELAKRIQREGIVLLRNAGDVLPLRKGAMVSVFGKGAVNPVYCDEKAAASSCAILFLQIIQTKDMHSWQKQGRSSALFTPDSKAVSGCSCSEKWWNRCAVRLIQQAEVCQVPQKRSERH